MLGAIIIFASGNKKTTSITKITFAKHIEVLSRKTATTVTTTIEKPKDCLFTYGESTVLIVKTKLK